MACGKNEPCFEPGECWGHWSGTMCKFLRETPTGSFTCEKTGELILNEDVYTGE